MPYFNRIMCVEINVLQMKLLIHSVKPPLRSGHGWRILSQYPKEIRMFNVVAMEKINQWNVSRKVAQWSSGRECRTVHRIDGSQVAIFTVGRASKPGAFPLLNNTVFIIQDICSHWPTSLCRYEDVYVIVCCRKGCVSQGVVTSLS